ncbi:MAG: TetR/AcrR family transcriptional regulator [Hyphomonas sp.]|nr:TetR/AcrR family transcriptional regulator [Hyphomonas sp.]MCB9961842.1 TetR/AcrR family transcriptional regulator [Hyphomonas sp.]MCB9972663.1 TetR/AcrR family transcriptional regulator [Hyphomonas sp.]MCC0017574.1 TetR/AcrR family transcriptional regulator [Rhodobiaceae bacterium]
MDTDYPPEATPARRRRKKVKESILAAAEKVFAEEGESGLSIRRLAEKIDYSPSAIYKYFGSKEELLDELKEAFFARLMEKVARISDTARPFRERAHDCLTGYVKTAVERPHHYAAAFSTIPSPDEVAARAPVCWDSFIDTRKGQAFRVLVDIVEEGQANRAFDKAMCPVAAAKSVWASLHGLALLMIHMPLLPEVQPHGGALPPDAFVAFHADLLLRGLGMPCDAPLTPATNGQADE